MLSKFIFSNFFSRVRPAISNKVLVVKCQRQPAKCWQNRENLLLKSDLIF